MEERFFADDRPRDYTEYINMSKAERDAEIARLEAIARAEKERLAKQEK